MVAIKVTLQVMIFALVLSMLATHQVWGEADCYRQKVSVKIDCMENIKFDDPYVRQG